MSRVQSDTIEIHRVGLEDVYAQYNENMTAFWKALFPKSLNSKQAYIQFMQEGDFPMAPVVSEATPIGDSDIFFGNKKTVTPIKRGLGFSMGTESQESDQYSRLVNIVKKIKLAMNKTREQAAADMAFNNAKTASGIYLNPDGLALASTAHTSDGANQSNLMTSAFGVGALETMVQNLGLTKSHRGDPDPQVGPFKLLVPQNNRFLAERIVFSAGQQGTANNDKNRVGNVITDIISSPFFNQSLYWALVNGNEDQQPLGVLERRAVQVKSDEDISLDIVLWRLTEMYAFFHRGWRGFYLSDGTA